jgi:RNA polymerase sigma-70 factor (ECF subfamily)
MEFLEDYGEGAATAPTVETNVQDDRTLAAALLRRDRKASAEFIARYADPIYRYVHSRLIPRTDLVDDLVQDIFIAAWENLASYRGDSPLGSWLHGIARHKVENYYRACLRAPLALDEADQDSAGSVKPDFDEFLDRERLQQKTRAVLATLPEAYSLALLWRYWEQCSAEEMAMRTGKTQKAIERLLARAREMFRERWNHE